MYFSYFANFLPIIKKKLVSIGIKIILLVSSKMHLDFSNCFHTKSLLVTQLPEPHTKCLLLRCVCDILNAVLYFARDVRHFAFCVCNSWMCVKLKKKRDKVLKMCKQLKKKKK